MLYAKSFKLEYRLTTLLTRLLRLIRVLVISVLVIASTAGVLLATLLSLYTL
jgi:hypothetical protein